MSRQERQIVFSGRDEGVLTLIERFADTSQRLSQTLTKIFAEEQNSAKKNIEDYEKQIKLIEKKTRLQNQSNQSNRNTSGGQSGEFQPKNNSFEVDRAKPSFVPRKDDDCCKTKIELLREIIQTIKSTSEDQIANRRELFEALNSSFQGLDIGGSTPSSRMPYSKGRRGGGGGIDTGDVMQALGGGAGMNSLLKTATGPLGAVLAIIGAFSAGVRKAFVDEMSREEALSQLSGTSGRSVFELNNFEDDGYFGRGAVGRRDRSRYGFSEDEFMSRTVSTARAFGTAGNINSNILNDMALQRGTGMDYSTILPLNRLARIMSGSRNATDLTQLMYGSMSGTGVFGTGGDLSRLNELMQTFAQFQEGQFLRTGASSNGAPFLNLRRQLELTGEGKFRRDDYTAATIGALNQGLYSEGSPEAQAIKLDILRRANPNLGFFELQAEQAKGIGANGLLEGVLGLTRSTGGDINQQAILFNQLTGGSLNPGDVLSLLRGDIDASQLSSQVKGGTLDIESRAGAATSDLRDAIDGVKGEISKFLQDFLNVSRNMPTGGQMINLIALIDAIKREVQ